MKWDRQRSGVGGIGYVMPLCGIRVRTENYWSNVTKSFKPRRQRTQTLLTADPKLATADYYLVHLFSRIDR